jgi:putative FmdB family regulatory protein
MPLYEYQCGDCGGSFEVVHSMSLDSIDGCELCEGSNVRRKIFAVGAIFKGSGFHATEYRSEEYKEREKQDQESTPATEKSADSENKTESKPKTSDKTDSPSQDQLN